MNEFKNPVGGDMLHILVRSSILFANLTDSTYFSFCDLQVREIKNCFLGNNLGHDSLIQVPKSFVPKSVMSSLLTRKAVEGEEEVKEAFHK